MLMHLIIFMKTLLCYLNIYFQALIKLRALIIANEYMEHVNNLNQRLHIFVNYLIT